MAITISNTTYKICEVISPATSEQFDLSPLDLNGNVFEKIYLDIDASNGDILLVLPDISLFGGVLNFQLVVNRVDDSENAVKIVAFQQITTPPYILQYIGSADFIQISQQFQNVVLTPTNELSWSAISTAQNAPLINTLDYLNQSDLATTAFVNLPSGSIRIIYDYNETGTGCTLYKAIIANGNYQDWYVMSTDNPINTGQTGVNPI